MKILARLFLGCLVAAAITSCVSPVERRMNRNPELFAKLSTSDKEAVQERRIKEGMGKDAVFFLLGRPARISEGTREGLKYERWIYTDYETVYAHEFGMGMGFGHHGCYYDPFFYGGPQFMSVPVQGATVEFVNGKISGYLVPRR